MRLESIVLHGFKSFGERSHLKILPGITAIVGPNGTGKSNISESVKWALGEQSAKSLRGHRMEDLIFHGSASRKAVGLAEVELTFSNDGAVAVPWSEITVTRRLYRTGESEYLLNKTPSRLRDILDVFAGTGASPRAYSVMDQEKLNHVLTAKPHERRVFIEEAAGIARYKQQRHETEGKLSAARQNLVRVKDVMDEVRRQLTSLERQARKAQQYKALEQQRRDIAVGVHAAEHAALATEGDRLVAEVAGLRDQEHALRARVARLAGAEAEQRQVIQDSEHRLSDLRQSLQKVQAELERLLERREQMTVQLQEAAQDIVRLEDEARQTDERLAGLAQEREASRAALAEAEALVAERLAAEHDLAERVQAHRGALAGERDRLEALRLEQVRIAGERTDLTRSAGELRERSVQLRRRAERLAAELAQTEGEAERLTAVRGALEVDRDRAIEQLTALVEERARVLAGLHDVERRLAAVDAALGEARVSLAARRSGLQALHDLERAREGYTSGVRAIFTESGAPRVEGVVGTVADLIEVPPDLERAVEAVLGERLQWVVVQHFEQARTAVEYLQGERAGSATFLPLDHLPSPGGIPDDNGIGWMARRVAATSPSLLHYLLGRVAVVDHLDHAEALWRRNGRVATYVTPAGEVLSPTGRLRGGVGDGAPAASESLLARKRQIRELEDEVSRLAADVERLQAESATLTTGATALRGQLPALEQQIHAGEAARVAGEKDLEQVSRDHERVARHRETIDLESRQVAAEGEETSAVLAQLEQRIEAARIVETSHESTIADLRRAIEAAQGEEAALVGALSACRVEVASARGRVEALGRELHHLDEMQADLTERLAQARARGTQVAERRVWLAAERDRTDGAAREVAMERDRLEVDTRQAAEEHDGRLTTLRGVEKELRALEAELSRLVGSIHEVDLRATERRVRREELLLEVQRAFGVDEAALRQLHDPVADVVQLRQSLAELESRLQSIGAVNLVADEEYRELDERLTFLRTQHDDLVASIKDLDKALRGMTRTAQERFVQAFEEINREFGRIFERLFEGGRAELRLVEAEEGGDPLDTGVELMAQPRGKRLQSVMLLSGGERALTGLALLFAIFYFRPSPFCVLDEVDAPLDDANIQRFLRVLRELTSQTQFLVITHNRSTMEAADLLYGVTMEEAGLSKLVSVRLNAETVKSPGE